METIKKILNRIEGETKGETNLVRDLLVTLPIAGEAVVYKEMRRRGYTPDKRILALIPLMGLKVAGIGAMVGRVHPLLWALVYSSCIGVERGIMHYEGKLFNSEGDHDYEVKYFKTKLDSNS